MKKYTISLSDEHVDAILQRIATMPPLYSQTASPQPQFADEAEYIAGVLKNDIMNVSAFIPAIATVEQTISTAQATRQATLNTLQAAVMVVKGTE